MPKVKTSRTRYPEGWDKVSDTLDEIQSRMREIEQSDSVGKRKDEVMWPIFRLHHQRSRYLYDMYYKKKEISKDVYEFALREGYGDKNLIAKWKKPGFERLCCLRCIQPGNTNFGTTCVCRVPLNQLDEGQVVECKQCGCRGCASSNG